MNTIKKQLHELKLKIKKTAMGNEVDFSLKSSSVGLVITVVIALVAIALIVAGVMVVINHSNLMTEESALYLSEMPVYLV